MIVAVPRLLRRVQLGSRSEDAEVRECARSCLSFLVCNLLEDTVRIPSILEPLYDALPNYDE